VTVLRMLSAANPGHELLESALAQLERAAKALNFDPGMHRFLQQPERTLTVALPVTMDDGRLEVFTGYRGQHSSRAMKLVLAKTKAYDCPPREAAFMVAVERVASVITKRRIFT
jgi:glutamate dehydrogenase/leucine dehydrogenase